MGQRKTCLSSFRLEPGEPNLEAIFFNRQICARAAQIGYLQGRFHVSHRGSPKAACDGERMANRYSRLKRVRSGMGHRSGNEERPVLADLHFHEGLEDELLLLKCALNGLREGNGGEAARLDITQQGKRNGAPIIDHDVERIGCLADNRNAQDVTAVERISVCGGRIRGEQYKGYGEATNHREHAADRRFKPGK
ncbi:hypothetical protein AJ88_15240 [Mesorhizobium amorphae CCBAU 01583]|nr:hypothetical protein AJ88_15240 [Mesorhizobium amorphae CCBAU 01583]